MKNKKFIKYYICCCVSIIIALILPFYILNMIFEALNYNFINIRFYYPDFYVPHIPTSIAVIIGIFIMPLCIKIFKKHYFTAGTSIAITIFFLIEMYFRKTIESYTSHKKLKLTSPIYLPENYILNEKNMINISVYIISIFLIITILSSLYGFGKMIATGEKRNSKSLVIQSICSILFYTQYIMSFISPIYTEEGQNAINDNPLISALLMTIFFIFTGITSGIFSRYHLLGKRKIISLIIPSIIASIITVSTFLVTILISRINPFLLSCSSEIQLLTAYILIILIPGCITGAVLARLNKKSNKTIEEIL